MYTGNDRFSGNDRYSGLQGPDRFFRYIRRYLYKNTALQFDASLIWTSHFMPINGCKLILI